MNAEFSGLAEALRRQRWRVQLARRKSSIPDHIALRYCWLPANVLSFVAEFESVVSTDESSWLTTSFELSSQSSAAFAWNQWELDSLAAAANDSDWQHSIKAFWDRHFPILLSVKGRYAYVAIRNDHKVVVGEEPEFEETEILAEKFEAFLHLLADGDTCLSRFV